MVCLVQGVMGVLGDPWRGYPPGEHPTTPINAPHHTNPPTPPKADNDNGNEDPNPTTMTNSLSTPQQQWDDPAPALQVLALDDNASTNTNVPRDGEGI